MKVRLKKIKLCSEELGLQIGEHTVSLKRFFDLVILGAIIVLAYNIGVYDANQIVKYTAYISQNGICNSSGCYKCYPVAHANQIVWNCANETYININNAIVNNER